MNTAKQSTRCPDTDSLREILQGDISSGDSEAILQHLLECDRCIKQADEISLSDPLIQTIRSRPGLEAFGWESDSELRKSVIERGMQLGDDTLTALDPTLAVDPAGTDGDSVSTDQATEIRRRLNLDFLAPADHPAELGRLGDFRIVEVLGRGGMGVVFKANDTTLDRIVALKIMVPDLNVTDALKQRFLREAKSMAAVEHGNVVEVYRVGEESGVPYVAMKYLRGQTLRSLVNQKGRLTEREIARIGRETADGLAAVHACGLIHRDLKPDNLWIEKSGTVKILDFGLAAADDDMNLTQSGMLVGTPAYMSPEQALSLELDARSDLFSFGSTLYLAACGKPAFDGKRPTALLMAVAKGEFEPVAQVCPDMDTELASVLSRLMALERDERYENANEVAVAFERIHDRLSHSESVLSPVASSDVGSGNRNRRYAIVALAAAVPLLLALFAVVMKFQMKGGTIELTIDDHAQPINVNLQNKDEIEIIDPIDGKPILIGVDRKAQQLVIRKAGFQTASKSFDLTDREGHKVHVRFLPAPMESGRMAAGESSDSKPGSQSLEDLEIVRWIVERGGSVRTESGKMIDAIEKLGTDPIGECTVWMPVIDSAEDLRIIAGLSGLGLLSIDGSESTGEGLDYLSVERPIAINLIGCPNLKVDSFERLQDHSFSQLYLSDSPLGDDVIAVLTKWNHTLDAFGSGTETTGRGLKVIAEQLDVKNLSLVGCNQLEPSDFDVFRNDQTVTEMRIDASHASARVFDTLASMPSLKRLQIDSSAQHHGPVDLSGLEVLGQITSLDIHHCQDQFTEAGIESIKKMTWLEDLSLAYVCISEADLREIKDALEGCNVQAGGLITP